MEIFELINLWKIEEDIYIIVGNKTKGGVYQGVRNVRFSENLACFVFLKHPF